MLRRGIICKLFKSGGVKVVKIFSFVFHVEARLFQSRVSQGLHSFWNLNVLVSPD